jgi:hypothetical protein
MPVPLRSDFDAVQLRVIARKAKEGPQARRLLALAAVYEGATRIEAAKIGGVTRAACRAFARSSRLASVRQAWRAREHHTRSAATQVPRTQSDGEHLAIYPRQLDLQPHFQFL